MAGVIPPMAMLGGHCYTEPISVPVWLGSGPIVNFKPRHIFEWNSICWHKDFQDLKSIQC